MLGGYEADLSLETQYKNRNKCAGRDFGSSTLMDAMGWDAETKKKDKLVALSPISLSGDHWGP